MRDHRGTARGRDREEALADGHRPRILRARGPRARRAHARQHVRACPLRSATRSSADHRADRARIDGDERARVGSARDARCGGRRRPHGTPRRSVRRRDRHRGPRRPDRERRLRRAEDLGIDARPVREQGISRRARPPQEIADLSGHHLIATRASPTGSVWELFIDGSGKRRGGGQRFTVRPRMSVNEPLAARNAALAGVGIALLPSPDVDRGELERVLPNVSGEQGGLWRLYPARRSAVRSCVEHLLATLPRGMQ
ncbi:MAG TPA: LysR substrate-binding domain-containing protein [Candidatus Limnocylindrales bacterium]|nr:LysR substrate-binding domain-containing protein [Candidatus Limnocylindrales bacterium]